MIKKILGNSKGLGIFELIVSIAIGSIILLTLTSVLMMVMTTNAKMKIEQRMENESYIMAETLKSSLLPLMMKNFVVTEQTNPLDDFLLVVDYCDVGYDENIAANRLICTNEDDLDNFTPMEISLVWDEDSHAKISIKYTTVDDVDIPDSIQIHDTNILLLEGTSMEFDSTYDRLTMILVMQIVLPDGSILDPQTYTTEIIFSNY